MARRKERVPFTPEGPFVARSVFAFNGRHTVVGKQFPHRKVTSRRLRQLYDSRRIDVVLPAAEPVAAEPVAAEPVAAEPVAAEPADWRQMDEQGILDHAFKVTGIRRRSVANAIKDLTDQEQINGGTADGKDS